jgi:RluA family pseudouridine synthase
MFLCESSIEIVEVSNRMNSLIADHILWEDDAILVVNKPAGLMVEPDRNGFPNVQQAVKRYLREKGITSSDGYAQHIHRLDRPVSGVLLFAIQREVLKNLSEQFAQRTVEKYYQALTQRSPDVRGGALQHWHRKEKKKAVIYTEEVEFGEPVRLAYNVNAIASDRFLWNIQLHTGKYHQIRAQLAFIGCPIIGDEKYGSELTYFPNAIALHAQTLTFNHPVTNERLTINAPANFR